MAPTGRHNPKRVNRSHGVGRRAAPVTGETVWCPRNGLQPLWPYLAGIHHTPPKRAVDPTDMIHVEYAEWRLSFGFGRAYWQHVDSALWLVVIGAVLLAAPFVIDF